MFNKQLGTYSRNFYPILIAVACLAALIYIIQAGIEPVDLLLTAVFVLPAIFLLIHYQQYTSEGNGRLASIIITYVPGVISIGGIVYILYISWTTGFSTRLLFFLILFLAIFVRFLSAIKLNNRKQ